VAAVTHSTSDAPEFKAKTLLPFDVYEGNNSLGDFHVMYESMSDNILMEVFDLVMNAYEDGKLENI
jgi:hypothetical protein